MTLRYQGVTYARLPDPRGHRLSAFDGVTWRMRRYKLRLFHAMTADALVAAASVADVRAVLRRSWDSVSAQLQAAKRSGRETTDAYIAGVRCMDATLNIRPVTSWVLLRHQEGRAPSRYYYASAKAVLRCFCLSRGQLVTMPEFANWSWQLPDNFCELERMPYAEDS